MCLQLYWYDEDYCVITLVVFSFKYDGRVCLKKDDTCKLNMNKSDAWIAVISDFRAKIFRYAEGRFMKEK